MAKKTSGKYQNGGSKRSERLSKRADKVMDKARKDYQKLRFAIDEDERNPSSTSNIVGYTDRLENRMKRREERARDLKRKSEYLSEPPMKKGGSVKKKKR